MNKRSVISIVAIIAVVIGLGILSAVPVGMVMRDAPETVAMFAYSGVLPIILGTLLYLLFKPERFELGIREGFAIVTFGWIGASVVGCLPFITIGNLHWYDAYFETMSGFSTTGASVMSSSLRLRGGILLEGGLESLPKSLLYWRSMTHWFGGMGIVVLSLAILPFLGIGGHQLYNAEVPGPTSDRLTPRIANSAKILWGVYVLLSVTQTLLLAAGGMSLFDAWCHTCGTLATGGFSTRGASIGAYNSAYFDWIVTLFMFLAGCNFILHFRALRGKPLIYFHNEEFRFYLALVVLGTLFITFRLVGNPIIDTAGREISGSWSNSLRYASFQMVSILTTTGFCTADFALWPPAVTLLLVTAMFIGGCGGSTGGGMKNSRIMLLLKYSIERTKRWMYPHYVSNVRLNESRIDAATMHKTLSFFFLFVFLFVFFALVLSVVDEMDIVTATTASIASLGNIGPGLGEVGATSTYHWLNPVSKIILTFAMLLGRLELYTVLVVLLPSFWKK